MKRANAQGGGTGADPRKTQQSRDEINVAKPDILANLLERKTIDGAVKQKEAKQQKMFLTIFPVRIARPFLICVSVSFQAPKPYTAIQQGWLHATAKASRCTT
ncbi:hypothetical protein FXN63_09960 [Pigmentiphaga aceris]|uniref:Uncharacterized protein n=1 Tax=Pigmentiphaga aceris TaxID=1940612 RepID=A0A5C0AWZ8_9BURK|nr:hypothetical protein [Pigmentiphaga aceris]QEI06124.1 hypothetical protein FXN63_09960 [Pigmentiphaga aceris]